MWEDADDAIAVQENPFADGLQRAILPRARYGSGAGGAFQRRVAPAACGAAVACGACARECGDPAVRS